MMSLKLLGSAERCLPEGSRLSTRKAVAVLAYLAVRSPFAVRRSDLTSMLWADVPDRQARHSLRQTLTEIRAALALYRRDLLATDRDTVLLDVRRMRIDARSMEWLVKRGAPASLRRACALYHGDFLAGLRVQETAFDEWLTGQRARLRALAWVAYRWRLEELLADDRKGEAVAVALRMIRIDRVAQWPRAALFSLYAGHGDFRAVCRHYESFARLLWRRYDTEPSPAIQRLFRHAASQCGWISAPPPRSAAADWERASTERDADV
jgi:DNA-binding SARP family transcriptional activator